MQQAISGKCRLKSMWMGIRNTGVSLQCDNSAIQTFSLKKLQDFKIVIEFITSYPDKSWGSASWNLCTYSIVL